MVNFTLANNGWTEFWNSLLGKIKDFFNPTLSGYTNFDFGSDNIVNLKVIVFGIFIGVMIASAYAIYTKKILGEFVRKLLSEDILDPSKAKTANELGFGKNPFVLRELKGYTLGRVVRSVEKDEFVERVKREREEYEASRAEAIAKGERMPAYREPRFDKKASECHYYIAEKDRYTAEMRFNANGSGYGTFFFVLLISIMCIILIYAILPHILAFTDAALSDFTVKGNTFTPSGTIIK